MEKAVNRVEGGEGDWKRDNLSIQNPQSIFREYGNGRSLNIQNAGNTANAVRHGIHGIPFRLQNALSINVSLADIARRQFVPTNCSQLPSSDSRGD